MRADRGVEPWFASAGWKVHGWAYPIVWWARRKPRSRLRQWLWSQTDALQMRSVLRHWRKIRRANSQPRKDDE